MYGQRPSAIFSSATVAAHEMRDGPQAHTAVLGLCDAALDEAERLMRRMMPPPVSRVKTPPVKLPRPPTPPPPASWRSDSTTACASSSSSGSLPRTSNSYYDRSFSRHRGKVFYSKDNTLKLIAFERNSGFLDEKEEEERSKKKQKEKNKRTSFGKKKKNRSRSESSSKASKVSSKKKTNSSSSAAPSTLRTTQKEPIIVTSRHQFEKGHQKYLLDLKGLVLDENNGLKELTFNGNTYRL